jgi:glyoxylase-like metal-dependent hydrolase (beta-lactamase superfamily II)
MLVKRFVVGLFAANCYVLADSGTKDACLIDPGAEAELVKNFLKKEGLRLKYIINTHGHGDHIAANGSFQVPIYIHSLDKDFLTDPDKNLSSMFLFRLKSPEASGLLEDGQILGLGGLKLEVLHTPGHTLGSISIKVENVVFTGDTLFRSSVGRTDFDYGDEKKLYESIRGKLLILDDHVMVYPGHGDPSTIGDEKKSNPFLTVR